jgi:uncharacterized integral membrane protein
VLRRLLLLPLLAPLLVVLLVAALNPRPAASLRLLTWRSPALPMGLWIGLAGAGGALLSAGATGLALRQGATMHTRRSRGASRDAPGAGAEPWEPEVWQRQRAREQQARWQAGPSRSDPRPEHDAPPAGWEGAGGSRAPGEPPPTVSVPFRVVRRAASDGPAAAPAPAREAQPEPVPAGDDWGSQASDDW